MATTAKHPGSSKNTASISRMAAGAASILSFVALVACPGKGHAADDLLLEAKVGHETSAPPHPGFAFERFLSDPAWSATSARGLLGFWTVSGQGVSGAGPFSRGTTLDALNGLAAFVAAKIISRAFPLRTELQASTIAGIDASRRAIQVGAILSLGHGVDGSLQASVLVNVSSGQVKGLEAAGVLNLARSVHGVQLGLVNVGGHVSGVQVGLVNVARELDGVPLGLVSVTSETRFELDLWTSGAMPLNVGARLATGPFHTMIVAGADPVGRHDRRFCAGLGGGLHLAMGRSIFVDVDLLTLATSPTPGEDQHTGPGLLVQARIVMGVNVEDGIALFAGMSADLAVSWSPRAGGGAREIPPLRPAPLSADTTLGPGFLAGIRLF